MKLNMKKIIFLAIIFGSVFIFSNCEKYEVTPSESAKPTTTNISVSLRKLASETGTTVNCNGLSVELHSNSLYTAKVKSTISTGSAASGTASFSAVPNGKYYLIAWKDVNGDNKYSDKDLFGFVETPLVLDGTAKSYVIDIYILKE
jgi:hypothetical protein